MTSFTAQQDTQDREPGTLSRGLWSYVRVPITAVAIGVVFLMAGVNIAAFLLGQPLVALAFALVGDMLLVISVLHLRKTGNSVDDNLSAPPASRR